MCTKIVLDYFPRPPVDRPVPAGRPTTIPKSVVYQAKLRTQHTPGTGTNMGVELGYGQISHGNNMLRSVTKTYILKQFGIQSHNKKDLPLS